MNNNTEKQHNNNTEKENAMKIYLVSTAYEGNAPVAFSSQYLAEKYLIEFGGDDVIAVELDGYGYEYLAPSEMLQAHIDNEKVKQEKAHAEFEEWYNNQNCEMCNLPNRSCKCWETTTCGEFGGTTKKGNACFNSVLVRENSKCHLHRQEIEMGYNKELAEKQRYILSFIKELVGCEMCRISNATVLDYDHIQPSLKFENVSRMVGRYATLTILREVAKCRVLCANCHRIHTEKQRK